ncbi:MAG: hypothetical protein ACR2MP_22880 [Streptosporangiaceae bacterium]
MRALPPLKFSAETGAAILGQHFSDVTFRQQDLLLSFPARARSWPISAVSGLRS